MVVLLNKAIKNIKNSKKVEDKNAINCSKIKILNRTNYWTAYKYENRCIFKMMNCGCGLPSY